MRVEPPELSAFAPITTAIQVAVLALVVLALGLFVVRPLLAGRSAVPGLPPPDAGEALTGEIAGDDFTPPALATVTSFDLGDDADDGALGTAMATAGLDGLPALADDPVARLRRLIEERQDETIEILRGWIENREESR